jgi:proteasome lid subunit RPN8/RPN11
VDQEILVLPGEIWDAIVAHAREGLPEEVCGLLRGREGVVTGVVRAHNVAEDREINYTVDAQTLLKQFEFEDAGEEMVAIYHSHPVTPAYPSATDAQQATYPDAVYVICSLADPAAPVLRGYRLLPVGLTEDIAAYPLTPVRGRHDFLAYHQPAPGAFFLLQLRSASDQVTTLRVDLREVNLVRQGRRAGPA